MLRLRAQCFNGVITGTYIKEAEAKVMQKNTCCFSTCAKPPLFMSQRLSILQDRGEENCREGEKQNKENKHRKVDRTQKEKKNTKTKRKDREGK
jgi:hypothetical protein